MSVPKIPTPRLRAPALAVRFHVALLEPEIPPNTGNIARLCAATGSKLHLIGKLGFRIDEHAVRRAGVDYWHLVDVTHHPDMDAFLTEFTATSPEGRVFAFTATATQSYLNAGFRHGDALLFGKESVGLADEVVARFAKTAVGIPTLGAVRSLNIANAVSIGLFEALRVTGSLAETFTG